MTEHYVIAAQRVTLNIKHTTRGPSWEIQVKDAPDPETALAVYLRAYELVVPRLEQIKDGKVPAPIRTDAPPDPVEALIDEYKADSQKAVDLLFGEQPPTDDNDIPF